MIVSEIRAIWAIYLRGLIILQQRSLKNIFSFFLPPTLYVLAFGLGVGQNMTMEGVSYINFMIPGLIAMSSMNQSYSVATEINQSRFFTHFFEEYILSPASNISIVLGNVLYGVTKGIVSFIAVLVISSLLDVLDYSIVTLVIPVLLNSFLFASLGVWVSLVINSHRDMNSFTTFIIVPMSFLSGTFFSIEGLPVFLKIASQIIPLTHSSMLIRAELLNRNIGNIHYFILIGYSIFFFIMAVFKLRRSIS